MSPSEVVDALTDERVDEVLAPTPEEVNRFVRVFEQRGRDLALAEARIESLERRLIAVGVDPESI